MKRVTVKDIANELGLSLGAINKALNNKPGLSNETRERVLDKAANMGYRVNKVAQSMARSSIKIGVVMPLNWREYYDQLQSGVDFELENLRDYNVQGRYYNVAGLHSYQETVQALKQCIQDDMQAVVLCSPQEFGFSAILQELQDLHIPVVLLGTSIANAGSICCVHVDAGCAGKLAAEFMSLILPKNQSVIVFVGNKDLSEHKKKAMEFSAEASRRNINVLGVYETHDDPEVAYFLTGKLIRECGNVGGIYAATANSIAICKYIEENNLAHVQLIGTDIFNATVDFVHKGIMKGVIYQNTEKQGSSAVRILYDFLAEGKIPPETFLVPPALVLSSNIDFYI